MGMPGDGVADFFVFCRKFDDPSPGKLSHGFPVDLLPRSLVFNLLLHWLKMTSLLYWVSHKYIVKILEYKTIVYKSCVENNLILNG